MNSALKSAWFSNASIGGSTECWRWQGATNRGYGIIDRGPRGKRRRYLAHRLAYEMAHGVQLVSDEILHHSCKTPSCVNPSHLLLTTRIAHRGLHTKTVCRQGHERAPGKPCRICAADNARRYRERVKSRESGRDPADPSQLKTGEGD